MSLESYLTTGLLAAACAHGASVVALAHWHLWVAPVKKRSATALLGLLAAAVIAAVGFAGLGLALIVPFLTLFAVWFLVHRVARDFSSAGQLFVATSAFLLLWGMGMGRLLYRHHPGQPPYTRIDARRVATHLVDLTVGSPDQL